MPTKKVADLPESYQDRAIPCHDSDHEPPSMMVRDAGVYEHSCPSCGQVSTFTVLPRMIGTI